MTGQRSRHAGLVADLQIYSAARTAEASEASEMATRGDDLSELALGISTAITRARRLNLPTSAYILSMVVVEVSEALKAVADEKEQEEGDAAG